MKTEKGVIMAVFNQEGRVLVLKRKKNWEGWELPKGGLENDDHRETVLIELEEEAGIKPGQIQSIEDMEHPIEWEYERDGQKRRKKYRSFKVHVEAQRVDTSNNPCDEHEHGFFLRPQHVKEMLEFENNVEVLEQASPQD